MKALSVRQPFAELIARGTKTLEIRSWMTTHRGPLLICAGGAWHKLGIATHGKIGERGVDVCVVDLMDVRPMTASDRLSAGLPEEFDISGQFAWVLADPRRVAPARRLGRLSLFDVSDDHVASAACPPSPLA